jgi:GNAT superfamily N-acetyltransferase
MLERPCGPRKKMECKIRIANEDEISLLVNLRIQFVKELHPEYCEKKVKELEVATKNYIEEHYKKSLYVGFIGEVNNKTVCTSGILIYNYPPLYSQEYRKIGHVLNFFTLKEHRKKGYGVIMMDYIKEYAKINNFYKIDLTSTEAGYGLYKKCGFIDSERNMEFAL